MAKLKKTTTNKLSTKGKLLGQIYWERLELLAMRAQLLDTDNSVSQKN